MLVMLSRIPRASSRGERTQSERDSLVEVEPPTYRDSPTRRAQNKWRVLQIGHAALPLGVSVGRLHAFNVLPRIIFDAREAETEEGLAFAEAFGIGISLHFKLGKLLLSLLMAATVFQLPALVMYARRGRLIACPREARRVAIDVDDDQGLDWVDGGGIGAMFARYSMAAVLPAGDLDESDLCRRHDVLAVACCTALATLALLGVGAAARELVRRDASNLRTLAPRPEHYALLLRDVGASATAATLARELRRVLLRDAHCHATIERVAVHHAVRPVLTQAARTADADRAARDAEQRATRHSRFARQAAEKRRVSFEAREQLRATLSECQLGERAIAAFVIFDSPRGARSAARALTRRTGSLLGQSATFVGAKDDANLPSPGRRPSAGALGRARPTSAPSPIDIIWENLEVSAQSRVLRRCISRLTTIVVVASGLWAVYLLRGAAIDEEGKIPRRAPGAPPDCRGPDCPPRAWRKFPAAGAPVLRWNETAAPGGSTATPPPGEEGLPRFFQSKYLERGPQRRALILVGAVVCLNSLLRLVVRRGAAFEAHSTRTTEQSATLLSYFIFTTLNTTGCYAVAAWRGARRTAPGARYSGSHWYSDVAVYLVTTLLWEAAAPPVGALARYLLRADALRSLRESEAHDESYLASVRHSARGLWVRAVAVPLRRYVVAPPWDATSRCSDCLRVFFIGAVFGPGQPLLAPLAAVALASMLAHDKWALLRERRAPPRLGAHLARTAAQIAPLAAPIHAFLALWTWSDADVSAAKPLKWWPFPPQLVPPVSSATWPYGIVLVACVVSCFALRLPAALQAAVVLCRAKRRRWPRHRRPNSCATFPPPRSDSPPPPETPARRAARETSPRAPPRSDSDPGFLSARSSTKGEGDAEAPELPGGDAVSDGGEADDDGYVNIAVIDDTHPPWRDAVRYFERHGILHSYDVYDECHPLLRTPHIARTSILASRDEPRVSVVDLLTPPRSRSADDAAVALGGANEAPSPDGTAATAPPRIDASQHTPPSSPRWPLNRPPRSGRRSAMWSSES
ncbi:hypothetical protein M885DRAFT_540391 [Pelagophyceae sp. CCMP2097]|nr:hypothetical protein M885DRAFT_540391 [Pelagophyceae sp. CCMP2097]